MGNQPVQIGSFRSATLYPPGEAPHKIPGDRVAAAGLQPSGHMVIVEQLDNGEHVQWWDVPCKIHRGAATGLVAPSSPIIPAT